MADMQRRIGGMIRHGTIHEDPKDGAVRVDMGPDKDGQPVLSPWLAQGDTHSGNVREEIPYKKGQNVSLLCPGGDPAQATLLPYSPNKAIKRPDHANDKDQVYQWDKHKATRNDKLAKREVDKAYYELTPSKAEIGFGVNFVRVDGNQILAQFGSHKIIIDGTGVHINP